MNHRYFYIEYAYQQIIAIFHWNETEKKKKTIKTFLYRKKKMHKKIDAIINRCYEFISLYAMARFI